MLQLYHRSEREDMLYLQVLVEACLCPGLQAPRIEEDQVEHLQRVTDVVAGRTIETSEHLQEASWETRSKARHLFFMEEPACAM